LRGRADSLAVVGSAARPDAATLWRLYVDEGLAIDSLVHRFFGPGALFRLRPTVRRTLNGDDLLLTPAVVRSEAGNRCAISHARYVASSAVRRRGRDDAGPGMTTILLLIAAVLAVTSAVCMVWIRVAAADHRQRWNLPDHSRLEPFRGAG
jgi:hypothetical protein